MALKTLNATEEEASTDNSNGHHPPENPRDYARKIIKQLTDGVVPMYNRDWAGDWAPVIDILREDYDPKNRQAFQKSLDALKKRQPALRELLDEDEPVGILMSDVVFKEIDWLWEPRIARGKITMIDGDPGIGKSIVTCDLAARVSSGARMPDGSQGIRGGVVIIAMEDDLGDTILPRLARAGARLDKIVSIGYIPYTNADGFEAERAFVLPDSLEDLEKAIKRVDAKLVIIDPVIHILGNKNPSKDEEVRQALSPIKMLAEKYHVAVVMLRHLNKTTTNDNPLYRGMGSIGFNGLARSAMIATQDPEEQGSMVLCHIKSNNKKLAPSLKWKVVSDEETNGDKRPYISWGGEDVRSARELMSSQNLGELSQEIVKCLRDCYPDAMNPQEVTDSLGEDYGKVKTYLTRLEKSGKVSKEGRGKYKAKVT